MTAPAVVPPPAMVTQSWVQESPEHPMVTATMTDQVQSSPICAMAALVEGMVLLILKLVES